MSSSTVTYAPERTLTVSTELIRQMRRRRTIVAMLLAVALPLVVVAAVKFGPQSDGGGGFGDGDLDLVGLATSGAWNFALTMLLFASGFLLTILVAMFFGDAVASEASWSTLRYLLAAPVPRRRLLRAKVVIGGALTTSESLQRLIIVTVYIGLTLLVPAGIAFLMSVLTDVPLAAVGAAVVIVIVANILDAIEALGDLRRLLPTDYGASWVDALAPRIVWDEMAVGASYSVVVFAVLVSVAVVRFDRKDITS